MRAAGVGALGGSHGRDRLVSALSLLLVAALAWVYLIREAASMAGSMPMEPAAATMGGSAPGTFALTFLMWTVMMAGMMLPSAAPAVLLYASMAQRNRERGTLLAPTWIFTAGYLAVWTGFSLVVSVLQTALQTQGLLGGGMASASAWLSSGILVAAGLYQWLPIKNACLAKCRNPLGLFMMRWRAGRRGAFLMGFEHGTYCVGCCWALMLILFVAGVMNLLWVAAITVFVFAEKLLPAGRVTTHLAGIGLVVTGLVVGFSS